MPELSPLIEAVKADTHSHVVVYFSDAGVHWRGESQSACQCMADVIGDCKVFPREEFLAGIESIEAEEQR